LILQRTYEKNATTSKADTRDILGLATKSKTGTWGFGGTCIGLVTTFMLQNQKQALGTLEGLVKTCKTKIKNTRYKIKNKKDSTESTQNQISPESFWMFEIISDDH
jgi:hypothetical protein